MILNKLLLTILMLGFLSGCASTPTTVSENIDPKKWVYVTNAGGVDYYINPNDVTDKNNIVGFLSKAVFDSEQTDDGLSYKSTNVLFIVLPNKNLFGIYSFELFDASGNSVAKKVYGADNISYSEMGKGSPVEKMYYEAIRH